jgi:hypothetical protein
MRRTGKKQLHLRREAVRVLSRFALTRAAGGSDTCGPDHSDGYCPGYSEANSCVAMCGL